MKLIIMSSRLLVLLLIVAENLGNSLDSLVSEHEMIPDDFTPTMSQFYECVESIEDKKTCFERLVFQYDNNLYRRPNFDTSYNQPYQSDKMIITNFTTYYETDYNAERWMECIGQFRKNLEKQTCDCLVWRCNFN
uniref:Venom protein n=1 Tax=Strongyloides papillosus TaxID=174720 RepID=A0A0N5BMP2_STREA